ncbi:membrane protein [Candidatus Brocadia sinica JPN1]|uniref:Membrane protein n=1 Tax=Candidatus Brocadia sinica JPN1 TaxID=1197129 RepID=A0ABQ0K0B3_9BACT|nr:membrane protein [Candidatus Brocadia sinica JPN1]
MVCSWISELVNYTEKIFKVKKNDLWIVWIFSIYFGIFIDKDFYKYTMQRVIRRL